MAKTLRGLPTVLVGMLLIAVLFTAYTAQQSLANHEPAMKTGAAASDVDEIRPDGKHLILKDTIRVSSSQDAIIQVTAECSIFTSLLTGEDEQNVGGTAQDSAYSFGEVQVYVTLDQKTVPVTYTDLGNKDQPVGTGGEVVFCNRAYQRTVQDRVADKDEGCEDADKDDDGDGVKGECEGDLDIERDFIDTRTANGFNWLAKDIGFNYDHPANGNNIIDVEVWAIYTGASDDPDTDDLVERCERLQGEEETCSEAYVGSRTLVVEPTNVAIHEFVSNPNGYGN